MKDPGLELATTNRIRLEVVPLGLQGGQTMCHTIDMPRSIRRAEDRFRRTTGAFIQPAEGGVISLSRRATSHDTDGRWVR